MYKRCKNIKTLQLQNVYKMRKYQNFAGAKELQGSSFPWAAGGWSQWSGHRVPRVQGGDRDDEEDEDEGDGDGGGDGGGDDLRKLRHYANTLANDTTLHGNSSYDDQASSQVVGIPSPALRWFRDGEEIRFPNWNTTDLIHFPSRYNIQSS